MPHKNCSFFSNYFKQIETIYFLVCLQDREIADVIPVDYTTPEKAVLASVFNQSEHPLIMAFKQDAVSDVDMDNKEVQLKPMKFPNKFLVAILFKPPASPFEVIHHIDYNAIITCKSGRGNITSCFTFHKKGKGNNYKIKGICSGFLDPHRDIKGVFGVTQTGELYLHGPLRTMPQGYVRFSWKLIRVFQVNQDPNQQLYLIASVDYPAMFLTSATKHISVGDPGDLGYWRLDQSGVAEARARRQTCSIN